MTDTNPTPNAVLRSWRLTHDRVVLGLLAYPRKDFPHDTTRKEDARDYPTAEEIANLNHDKNAYYFRTALRELNKLGVVSSMEKPGGRQGATTYKLNSERLGELLFFFIYKRFHGKELPEKYHVPKPVIKEIARFIRTQTIHLSAYECLLRGKTARAEEIIFKMLFTQTIFACLGHQEAFEKLNENAKEKILSLRRANDVFINNLAEKVDFIRTELPQEEKVLSSTAFSFWEELLREEPFTKEKIPLSQEKIENMFSYLLKLKKKNQNLTTPY